MHNAIDKFSIAYQRANNSIHPTKLTDAQGNPLKEINAVDVGVQSRGDIVADNYFAVKVSFKTQFSNMKIAELIKEVYLQS